MRKEELVCEKRLCDEMKREINVKYFILSKEVNPESDCEEWGIGIETENDREVIKYISPDYNKVTDIIKMMIKYDVTPVSVCDVMSDLV